MLKDAIHPQITEVEVKRKPKAREIKQLSIDQIRQIEPFLPNILPLVNTRLKDTTEFFEDIDFAIANNNFDLVHRIGLRDQELLSADDEINLFTHIMIGESAHLLLNNDLIEENDVEFLENIIFWGKEAENVVAKANHGLIIYTIEQKYPWLMRELTDDHILAGTVGLALAIKKFDPELGFKFSTMAVNWIRATIGKSLEKEKRHKNQRSLNDPISDEIDAEEFGDSLIDETSSVENNNIDQHAAQIFIKSANLTDDELRVLNLRHLYKMNPEMIANEMGKTQSYVRTRYRNGMRKLNIKRWRDNLIK